MVAALKAELDATKADNARLQKEVAQARRVSKPVSAARSTPPRKAFASPSDASANDGGGGSGKAKTRRVKAPSSRLYNPSKLQQKAEKLAKAREEAELAKCSFKPKTKAGAKATANNTTKRGTSASNRLFEQAKRHQEKRRSLADSKDDLAVKECTFSPSLDERSVKIASVSAGTKGETFSRLSAPRTYKTKEMVRGCVHHQPTHRHTTRVLGLHGLGATLPLTPPRFPPLCP